jgi:hypothetical protein
MEVLFRGAETGDLDIQIKTQTVSAQSASDLRELSFIVDRLEVIHLN